MTRVIRVIQAVYIILPLAKPMFKIQTSNFIIILNAVGIVLLFFKPFPSAFNCFLPGLIHDPGSSEFRFDLFFSGAIKHWRNCTEAHAFRRPTKVHFQNLTDVHTTRHTQWIQNEINRRTIFKERHIFHRYDFGNHTLVTVTPCHLIPCRDLASLCH